MIVGDQDSFDLARHRPSFSTVKVNFSRRMSENAHTARRSPGRS
jgi:hypothetical protein